MSLYHGLRRKSLKLLFHYFRPKNRITFDNAEYAHTNAKHSACNYDLDDFDVRWLGMTKTKNKRGIYSIGFMLLHSSLISNK